MTIDLLQKEYRRGENLLYRDEIISCIFRTNSVWFDISFSVENINMGNYPHIGSTLRWGICLFYRRAGSSQWYGIDAYGRQDTYAVSMSHILEKGEEYDVLVYGPILSKLTKLSIYTAKEAKVTPVPESGENILFLGGMHSFGTGCTTAGCMFSNIIGRKRDVSVFRAAANAWDYLPSIFQICEMVEKENRFFDVIVMECDYHNQKNDVVKQYLEQCIVILKKHTNQMVCWDCLPVSHDATKQIIDRLQVEQGIIYKDFSWLYKDPWKEMSVFSNHFINDTANMFIAKKLIEDM